MSMLENPVYIEQRSESACVRQQEKKYECPVCGKLRTVHANFLYPLQTGKAAAKKKYRIGRIGIGLAGFAKGGYEKLFRLCRCRFVLRKAKTPGNHPITGS